MIAITSQKTQKQFSLKCRFSVLLDKLVKLQHISHNIKVLASTKICRKGLQILQKKGFTEFAKRVYRICKKMFYRFYQKSL